MPLGLSICIKKRTKFRSGNPYGRTCLDSWGRQCTTRRGAGAAVRPSRPIAKSATGRGQEMKSQELLLHVILALGDCSPPPPLLLLLLFFLFPSAPHSSLPLFFSSFYLIFLFLFYLLLLLLLSSISHSLIIFSSFSFSSSPSPLLLLLFSFSSHPHSL